jgi:hypothetical protein
MCLTVLHLTTKSFSANAVESFDTNTMMDKVLISIPCLRCSKIYFSKHQLAEWARMDGFLLVFQQRLDGIFAKTEALRPPCQKQSRHLGMFRGLAEQDALFVLEMLCHSKEG